MGGSTPGGGGGGGAGETCSAGGDSVDPDVSAPPAGGLPESGWPGRFVTGLAGAGLIGLLSARGVVLRPRPLRPLRAPAWSGVARRAPTTEAAGPRWLEANFVARSSAATESER